MFWVFTSPHIVPKQSNPRPPLQNTMRILVINFQSIRAKKTPFWLLLTECNPDIIIGSETWLSPGNGIYEREILQCGHHIVARKDRKGSPHGGVLIATKDTINGTEIDMDSVTHSYLKSWHSKQTFCLRKKKIIISCSNFSFFWRPVL